MVFSFDDGTFSQLNVFVILLMPTAKSKYDSRLLLMRILSEVLSWNPIKTFRIIMHSSEVFFFLLEKVLFKFLLAILPYSDCNNGFNINELKYTYDIN